MPDEIKIILHSNYDELDKVEELLQQLKQKFKIPSELYDDILISVTEAVTNAITHGNQLNPDKKVLLKIIKEPQCFIFEIQDEGNGFNPEQVPDPTKPENIFKPSGRGIYVIKKLADALQVLPPGNKIRIKFLQKDDCHIC